MDIGPFGFNNIPSRIDARLCAHWCVCLGVNIRVIDPFTIKPLDAATIVSSARATGGRIITVEDHYREGGLGEAVLSAVGEEPGVVVTRLAVNRIPRSGKPQELLDLYGISAKHIADTVRQTFAN
ncbi:unnamed protein product [Oncorhynchus mykiss]|uniref:transketolase n=1 Tax=Oncorhynchus mykiss TaxID=8022 RepID=A0A060ZAC2_ONCMY|nr:unnamed protein product [Oncorhynchus mykiss]